MITKKSFEKNIQKLMSMITGELRKQVNGLNQMMVKSQKSLSVVLFQVIKRPLTYGGDPVSDIWRFGKVGWRQKSIDGKLSAKKRIFAKYVASGFKPIDAYMKAFPDCESVDYANRRVGVLLKSEKVRNLIDKEIELILNDTGITKTYLLEQTKEIVDKGDSRDSDKLRALETLMKISGMLSTEKKTESLALIQEFSGFSQEKLNAFKTGALPPNGKE